MLGLLSLTVPANDVQLRMLEAAARRPRPRGDLVEWTAEETALLPEGSAVAEMLVDDALMCERLDELSKSTKPYIAPTRDRIARSKLVTVKPSAATHTIEGPAGVSSR